MTNKKRKYYVVWYGHEQGIYESWDECRKQIIGFKGAKYKSYPSREQAEEAFILGSEDERKAISCHEKLSDCAMPPSLPQEVLRNAVAVDASCSGNPGMMEYRGIYLKTGRQLFHFGPMFGTNNIGEFLAIVHTLALIKRYNACVSVYSDSRNAILWTKAKKCKTTLPRNDKTEELFRIIERAEDFLRKNNCNTPIVKWNTTKWGEIPADFGRKH